MSFPSAQSSSFLPVPSHSFCRVYEFDTVRLHGKCVLLQTYWILGIVTRHFLWLGLQDQHNKVIKNKVSCSCNTVPVTLAIPTCWFYLSKSNEAPGCYHRGLGGQGVKKTFLKIQAEIDLQWNCSSLCFFLPTVAASPPHSAAPGSYIKQYKNDAAAFSLRCIPAVCSTASPAFEKYTNIELDKTMCLHVVGFQSLVQFLADRSESKRRKQKDVVKPSALPVGKSLQYRFPDCRLAKVMGMLVLVKQCIC